MSNKVNDHYSKQYEINKQIADRTGLNPVILARYEDLLSIPSADLTDEDAREIMKTTLEIFKSIHNKDRLTVEEHEFASNVYKATGSARNSPRYPVATVRQSLARMYNRVT